MQALVNRHIVFDFDGTVVDSYPAIIQCVQIVLSELLERPVPMAELKERYSPHLPELLKNFNLGGEDVALTTRMSKRWSQLSVEMDFNYVIFPGMLELINELKNFGADVHLWTARDRASTLKIKNYLGIHGIFKDWRCGDDTETKPHPAGIKALVGNANREDVIVIGDSHMDIRGAKSFGCASIGALWCQAADKTGVLNHAPDYVAHTPAECLQFIMKKFEAKRG